MDWMIAPQQKSLQLLFVTNAERDESLSASLRELCSRKDIGFGVANIPACQESMANGLDKEATLFIIYISPNPGENADFPGYNLASSLKNQRIPLRRIKFYTVGKPLLEEVKEKYNLVLSLCDYIATEASPEIDTVMVERWINDSLEIQYDKKRLKETSFLRHSASSALGDAIKSLERYQEQYPDFQIPATLYYLALQAILISENLESEHLNKFFFRLPAEDTLRKQGFCKNFIDSLADTGRMARALAEFRLGNDSNPIFPKQLSRPTVEIQGDIPFQEMGLENGIEVSVFIAILVTLLKESIEHTERYIRDKNLKGRDQPTIQVYTDGNDKICIKNPCLEEAKPLTEKSFQKITLEVFAPHVHTWQVQDPEIRDGFWIRCLTRRI